MNVRHMQYGLFRFGFIRNEVLINLLLTHSLQAIVSDTFLKHKTIDKY